MTTHNIADVYVSNDDLPWKCLRDGYDFKLLRTCSVTGTWAVLFRTIAGGSVPPHKHISAAEYFVLKGKVEVRGGKENGGVTAVAGDYGYEPNGIIHEKTYFPEPTEYLFISHGPFQYLDVEGNTSGIIDWLLIQEKWDSAEIADQAKNV
jgi:hypothetical protein